MTYNCTCIIWRERGHPILSPWWRFGAPWLSETQTQHQGNGYDVQISIVQITLPSFARSAPPPHPPPQKNGSIYICCRFLKRVVMTPIPNDVSERGALWGRKGSSWREMAPTIQSLWIRYFRCKMDIRAETWQSAPGFDGNRYRQWPVAGSVGCLCATREAYQMTLKISSTTIKFQGEWARIFTFGGHASARDGLGAHVVSDLIIHFFIYFLSGWTGRDRNDTDGQIHNP